MKYLSNSKSVQKALNSYIIYVRIPVALALVFLVLFFAWTFPLFYPSIQIVGIASGIIGIVSSTFVVIRIGRIWFRYYLVRVDNPREFYQRAIDYRMVSQFNADCDFAEFSLNLRVPIPEEYKELPTLVYEKDIELTNDKLILQGKIISLNKLESFRLTPFDSDGFYFNRYTLFLEYKNNIFFTHEIKLKEGSEFEWKLYEYLENQKLREN